MSDQSPLVRRWLLLKALSARHYGVQVREMAQELGVTEKTVRRDLQVFCQVGFPIEETVGDRGRKTWRMRPASSQPPMSFAFDEAIALYLGRRFLEPLAGTLFWEAAQRAFRKIRASLGSEALRYLEKFRVMFHQTTVGASDYLKKAELIDQLMVGIEDSRAVFITYQSLQATEPVTYDIYPYGFTYHRGSLYVIGHSPDHNETRHWKVDRIEEAEVTPVHFPRPEDFDLQEHLAKSFGVYHGHGDVRVKVRFSPTVARYVEESKWHASQQLAKQEHGSLIAKFDLDDTEEIKRWIFSFGRHAEVLEPEELRREVAGELKRTIEKYGKIAVSDSRDT